MLWINIKLIMILISNNVASSSIFCINFVFIYFVFMFCKILTWLVTILLQDTVAPYGNTCMKNMVIFFLW